MAFELTMASMSPSTPQRVLCRLQAEALAAALGVGTGPLIVAG